MLHLIVLDPEKAYVIELLKQISMSWPDLSLLGTWSTDQLARQMNDLADQSVLLLYNQLEQPNLPGWSKKYIQASSLEKWNFLPLYPDGQTVNDRPADFLYRLDSIEKLFECIDNWLTQEADKSQNSNLNKLKNKNHNDPKPIPEKTRVLAISQDAPQIWFILRLKPAHSDLLIKKMLKSALSDGLRTIYLPLMPTYLMHLISLPNQGPTLSDLLLLLSGNAINERDAGHYLQPTQFGWLQFRAPVRSDDLVSCDQSGVRQLLQFIRRSISKNPAFVLVDCQGIALSSALAAAVTADVCQIILPDSVGYARQAVKRELNWFLNQLPASCQVIIDEPDEDPIACGEEYQNSEV